MDFNNYILENEQENQDRLTKAFEADANDIQFQQWFLQYLRDGTNEYEYLSDRIAVNTGQLQKYGTQKQ